MGENKTGKTFHDLAKELHENRRNAVEIVFEEYVGKPEARNDILAKRFGLPMCSMGADLSLGDDFCSFSYLTLSEVRRMKNENDNRYT